MDLSSYVDTLRHELAVAARSAGPEAETLAERLTAPLESATRLVLQEAVSDAAQEISRDLAPGSVDVRLRGRDLGFVVDRGPEDRGAATDTSGWPATGSAAPPPPPDAQQDAGEAGTARITVRLPETLKARSRPPPSARASPSTPTSSGPSVQRCSRGPARRRRPGTSPATS